MKILFKWVPILAALCVLSFDPFGGVAAEPPPETPDAAFDADALYDPFEAESGLDAGNDEQPIFLIADPLEGFNRAMFTFNDDLYFGLLKPIAVGYRWAVPTPVRVSVSNFFFNLLAPLRLVNCLLQGKFDAAGGEVGRFLVNTTVGALGIYDPARELPGMNPPEEDLGQTLGYYGIGSGFFIVWPFTGPSSLRDTVGAVGDWALNPFSFMQLISLDAGVLTSSATSATVFGVRFVNETSFRIGDYEALKAAALDPYEAFRDAYVQNRNSEIAK
jgi:phospholipid-binding lipoprotein MlaA